MKLYTFQRVRLSAIKSLFTVHSAMVYAMWHLLRLAGEFVELTLLYLPLFYLATSAITDLVMWDLTFSRRRVFYPECADSSFFIIIIIIIYNILSSITHKMQSYTIFFITVNFLHVLDGFSAHHQELKNCTHSIWYMSSCNYIIQ